MNVVMTGDGRLVEVQATAERDPFSRELLDALLDLAAGGIEELAAGLEWERGGEEARTTYGVLTRSTGRPGRPSSTNETESWYQPGVTSVGRSRTLARRPAAARPVVTATAGRRGRRRRRAR